MKIASILSKKSSCLIFKLNAVPPWIKYGSKITKSPNQKGSCLFSCLYTWEMTKKDGVKSNNRAKFKKKSSWLSEQTLIGRAGNESFHSPFREAIYHQCDRLFHKKKSYAWLAHESDGIKFEKQRKPIISFAFKGLINLQKFVNNSSFWAAKIF